MALPFLPHEQIPGAFYELKALSNDHPLDQLCDYVEGQWITSNFYQPKRWSLFSKEIRTNNDVEGWHRRLNNHAKRGQIQFYLLVKLLHREGSFVTLQTILVSEGEMKRQQRNKFRGLQGKVKKYWKKYNDRNYTVNQLLSSCSHRTSLM